MRITFSLCALLLVLATAAQTNLYDSVKLQRDKVAKTGMVVLGSWSVASIGSGLVGYQKTTGTRQQFHRMNAIIGGVNLALSGLTLYAIQKRKGRVLSPAQTFRQQESAEKLFLFNTALDLGYVGLGFYLRERANRFTNDKFFRTKGAGNALILQGGFLALFDGVLYVLNNKNGNRLNVVLDGLVMAPTQNGLGLVYSFNR